MVHSLNSSWPQLELLVITERKYSSVSWREPTKSLSSVCLARIALGFYSRPECQLTSVTFFMMFLTHARQMREDYIKTCHDHFLKLPSQFLIHNKISTGCCLSKINQETPTNGASSVQYHSLKINFNIILRVTTSCNTKWPLLVRFSNKRVI
jgi:hypothetical protein